MTESYIAISRAPRGTFQWAIDQLYAGNDVRRYNWPIEVDVYGRDRVVRIWHLYRVGEIGICKGFNSGVVGADNDQWGDLGHDSHGYAPAQEDIIALDWQLVSDVTGTQVEYLDTHRTRRICNSVFQREIDFSTRRRIGLGIAAVIAVALMLVLIQVAHAQSQDRRSPRLPDGYTCEDVRYGVRHYAAGSVILARVMARAKGFTKRQIREAEKCLS